MKKVCIVSHYGDIDESSHVSKCFKKYGYIVDCYPLFKTICEYYNNDTSTHYRESFKKYTIDSQPDIVFWNFIDVDITFFDYISIKNRKYVSILYHCNSIDYLTKFKNIDVSYFDVLYTSIHKSYGIEKYSCFKKVEYIIPCVDDDTFYVNSSSRGSGSNSLSRYTTNTTLKSIDSVKSIDISICCIDCDSEVEDGFTRKSIIIDKIIDIGYSITIYGPEHLKYKYGSKYGGLKSYSELKEVYDSSKINLCFHTGKYFSRKLSRVLFLGGIVLTDIDLTEYSYVCGGEGVNYIKNKNIYMATTGDSIKNVLDDILSRDILTYSEERHEFLWSRLIRKIHIDFCNLFFDSYFYSDIFIIDRNIIDLKKYWIEHGIDKMHIPYFFNVDKNFKYIEYYNDNKNTINPRTTSEIKYTRHYIYWHYMLFSKNSSYIETKDEHIESYKDNKTIDFEGFIKINSFIKSISNGKYEYLENLFLLKQEYPLLNLTREIENIYKSNK